VLESVRLLGVSDNTPARPNFTPLAQTSHPELSTAHGIGAELSLHLFGQVHALTCSLGVGTPPYPLTVAPE